MPPSTPVRRRRRRLAPKLMVGFGVAATALATWSGTAGAQDASEAVQVNLDNV